MENQEIRVVSLVGVEEKDIKKHVEGPIRSIVNGGVVVMPTETVYGLAANALDPVAVNKIYALKGRQSDNPLIVHVSSRSMLMELVSCVPESCERLIKKFWPGALTIIFQKSERVPYAVTSGKETVAIRMPSNKIALELISGSNRPLAAPSANVSGRPSPTMVEHVLEDFKTGIDYIIDGGQCDIGLESTVVNTLTDPPMILRSGKVTYEELKAEIPGIIMYKKKTGDLEEHVNIMPGMKYTHYAPRAKLIIIAHDIHNQQEVINRVVLWSMENNKKIAVLLVDDILVSDYVSFRHVFKFKEVARDLFKIIRKADNCHVDMILSQSVDNVGVGMAVMDRLRKASSLSVEDSSVEGVSKSLKSLFNSY